MAQPRCSRRTFQPLLPSNAALRTPPFERRPSNAAPSNVFVLFCSAGEPPRMKTQKERDEEQQAPLHVFLSTYFGYVVLIVFGHIRDFFGRRIWPESYKHLREQNVHENARRRAGVWYGV